MVSTLKQIGVADQKKYIHVLGVTNAGKSSLLNSLRIATKKCKSLFTRVNPKYYRDPFDIKAAQAADKEFQKDEFEYEQEVGELTVSFFPGTTLKSKEVENVKLGTRVGSK